MTTTQVRARAGAAIAVGIAVLLAGCTAVPAQPSADATPTASPAPAESSVAAEPETEQPVPPVESELPVSGLTDDGFAFTFDWEDEDGYSYTYILATISATSEVNTVDALPGEALVTARYILDGALHNTTPERNAPEPERFVTLPLWGGDSPICEYGERGMLEGGPEWCSLTFVYKNLLSTNGFEPEGNLDRGNSRRVTLDWSETLTVPEESSEEVALAIENPQLWAFGASDVVPALTKDCVLESGVWLLAETAPTGCPAG